jgi:hypothetical protein
MSRRRERLAAAIVPACSLALLVLMTALVLASAGKTFGYDYDAYIDGPRRFLDGRPLYDPSIIEAGPHGLFLYPPPFALAMLPFAALPDAVARFVWVMAMAVCMPIGAVLLPVRRDVRWTIVLLAALDWLVLYSIKLGQVGPLLFLLFAVAWRWLDRVWPVAIAIAVGTLVKVQPAILIVWAALAGRWRLVWASIGILAAVCAASTIFTGIGAWPDYLTLLRRISPAASVINNCSLGAVLYQAGVEVDVANNIQWLSTLVTAGAVLLAWRFARPVGAFQITVLASQLLTPLLWDHYAMLLLLPVAWLLQRGRYWAVAFPLLSWLSILGWTSLKDSPDRWLATGTIPLTFFLCLAALLWEARAERREAARAEGVQPA